jgi:hypothetical protein
MSQIEEDLAAYIAALEQCSLETNGAEDHPRYRSLLADAAPCLAAVVLGATDADVRARLAAHDRLWSETWLDGSVYKLVEPHWSNLRRRFSEIAV